MTERQKEIDADKARSYQAFETFGRIALASYFQNNLRQVISSEDSDNPLVVLLDRKNALDALAVLNDGTVGLCSKVCFKPNLRQFQIRYSRPNGLATEFFKLSDSDAGLKPDYIVQTITAHDSSYACVAIINRRDFLYAVRRGYATIQEHPDKSKSINVPFSSVKSCKSFFTRLINRQEEKSAITNKEGSQIK